MKKLWDNPELTVLVKRKSDEVILKSCKSSGTAESTTYGICYKNHEKNCVACRD